ncbi:NUDIX hydrolase [Frankia sp. Cppng1_Ct_nod]|uniref:NUDIX hydrolase n=1 Tax=Frankia sp. Cppng1_Ct_nod TaxID=2897162 RepID=UPI001F5F20B5|nr:NUDIX hydrolase [Frankia sp. Cppng1_Ct_nod]
MSNNTVAGVVLNYLDDNPGEIETLGPLVLASMAGPKPVTDRSTMPAHVTCGAVAVTADWRVLHVQHRRLERWLLPGGHLEPSDRSLLGAALRELAEETGIAANTVIPDAVRPVDIDAHVIPENPDRGEPAHIHYDVRFLLHVPNRAVELRSEEVSDHRWVRLGDLMGTLGDKLRARRALPGPARLAY